MAGRRGVCVCVSGGGAQQFLKLQMTYKAFQYKKETMKPKIHSLTENPTLGKKESTQKIPGKHSLTQLWMAFPKTFLGFPGGSHGKESTCNAGDTGSIPGSRRSPGEGKGYPLQYSCLENSMDRKHSYSFLPWLKSAFFLTKPFRLEPSGVKALFAPSPQVWPSGLVGGVATPRC